LNLYNKLTSSSSPSSMVPSMIASMSATIGESGPPGTPHADSISDGLPEITEALTTDIHFLQAGFRALLRD
jgi:hypothetical protein